MEQGRGVAQELTGRVAIVTGAADGEGLTAAEALLRAGVRVAIWDGDAGPLAEAEHELRGAGLDPYVQVVDVGPRAGRGGLPRGARRAGPARHPAQQRQPEERLHDGHG